MARIRAFKEAKAISIKVIKNKKMNIMEELTINIRYDYAEGQGYYFDIYDKDSRDIDYEVESLDGGICTGTLEDTLEMATEMVREIIKK